MSKKTKKSRSYIGFMIGNICIMPWVSDLLIKSDSTNIIGNVSLCIILVVNVAIFLELSEKEINTLKKEIKNWFKNKDEVK